MIFLAYLPEIAGFLLLIMMSTQLPEVGPFLILGEFAIVALLAARYTTTLVDVVLKWWWLMLAPIIALISSLWSEAPGLSARYASQLLFTCFVGLFLARLLTPRRYITVLMVAMFVFSILCILNGRQGTSADGFVLIGLTGSKNQLGYVAQILFMAALAVLMMRVQSMPLRWIAILSLPLGAYLLAGTNSSTAVLMAIGGSFTLLRLWWGGRFPPAGRIWALLGLAVVASPLILLAPEINDAINQFVFGTLNKDPTLTGRTELWAIADTLIAQKPWLGWGFQSVWLGDSSTAIGLKRIIGFDGRSFHFHDSFRQAAVDTGYVGLAAFAGVMIAVGLASLRTLLLRPNVANSYFVILFILMVMRAFTDMLLGPFSIHTLLYFACALYALSSQGEGVDAQTTPAPLRWAPPFRAAAR